MAAFEFTMQNRRINSLIRCILAVALVGGGSVPALSHSHQGGGKPHQVHAVYKTSDHGHSHAHPHRHQHSNHRHIAAKREAPSAGCLSGNTRHTHVSWFGICWTLPCSGESDNQHGSSGPPQFTAEKVVDSTAVSPQTSLLDTFSAFAATVVIDSPDAAGLARTNFASIPAVAAPLCDSARHERSGVQLV